MRFTPYNKDNQTRTNDHTAQSMTKSGSVVTMFYNKTPGTKVLGEATSDSVVKKERTVTISLLGHLKKWYGVEDAKEIQGLCEESTSQGT